MARLRGESARKILLEYWRSSELNDFTGFSFNCLFTLFEEELAEKLALHGVLSFDAYTAAMGKYMDSTVLTPDLATKLLAPAYEKQRAANYSDPTYQALLTLHAKLQTIPTRLEAQIVLAEECIHAEHYSGKIFGFNMDQIRAEAGYIFA